ncbi:hypothetical protein JCM6882_006587 [Rhodosporidiobolus microsporus]
MSSSTAALSQSWPSGLTLTGGIPTKSQDLAAAIIFIVAFALLIPVAVWRWSTRSTRTWTLLRPTIVLLVRIATYIIRAIEANGNYSQGLFIGEQVLLLAGLVPLVEPLVVLLRAHVRRNWIPVPPAQGGEAQRERSLLDRALRILQLAVLVALILGIVAGSKAGDATADPDAASSLKTYRYAAIGLTMFVLGLTATVAGVMHTRESLPVRGTLYIFVVAAVLFIPNIYKLVTSVHPPTLVSSGTKAAFYLLSALPEFLAIVLYLSVNLNDWFGLPAASWKEKVEKKMRKGKWPSGMAYVEKEDYERIQGGRGVEMGQAPKYTV